MHPALIQAFKKHINLTAEEEELITASFRYKKIRRNQLLVQPPDIALHEHFVISGCLAEYYLDDNGTQHTLLFAPEGNLPLLIPHRRRYFEGVTMRIHNVFYIR